MEGFDKSDYYKEITEDEYTSIYYNNTGLDLDSYQDNKESFNLVEVKWLGDNLNIRKWFGDVYKDIYYNGCWGVTDKINFDEVFETSIDTLRISVDGTKTFVNYDINQKISFIDNLETIEGYYSYNEIIDILSTSEWNKPRLIP